jgi:hypothetical protein
MMIVSESEHDEDGLDDVKKDDYDNEECTLKNDDVLNQPEGVEHRAHECDSERDRDDLPDEVSSSREDFDGNETNRRRRLCLQRHKRS